MTKMQIVLLSAVALLVLADLARACNSNGGSQGGSGSDPGPKGDTPSKGEGPAKGGDPTPSSGDNNPLSKALGKDATTEPWGAHQRPNDPPADKPDLNCDFDKPDCCWSNAKTPDDTLDFLIIKPPLDDAKFSTAFKTSVKPNGQFAGVGSDQGSDTAIFLSCPIKCVQGDALVTLNHWAADGIKLQACAKDVDTGNVHDCQEFPAGESPGPSLAQVKAAANGGKNVQIVIQALNFPSSAGMALMDDITVDYQSCGGNTTSAPSTGGGGAGACAAQCDTASLCAFQAKGDKPFASASGQLNNHVTGIRARKDGKPYLATYMDKKGESSMEATPKAPLDADAKLAFEYYEATDKMTFKGCCDDNCSFTTTDPNTNADLQWKQGTLSCPAGTKKIAFKCMNDGPEQGACAIANIQAQDASGAALKC